MGEPLTVDAGELPSERIVEAVTEGSRVIINTTILGEEYEILLRRDDHLYYCETPTRLHRHDSESALRECIRKNEWGANSENTEQASAGD